MRDKRNDERRTEDKGKEHLLEGGAVDWGRGGMEIMKVEEETPSKISPKQFKKVIVASFSVPIVS